MQMISSSAATLAVSMIYCIWRTYHQRQTQRDRTIRDRVTYLLWVMAHQVG